MRRRRRNVCVEVRQGVARVLGFVVALGVRARAALLAATLPGAACARLAGLSGNDSLLVPEDAADDQASAAPEAGAALEGSAPDGAADASTYCTSLAPRPLFCADFDQGAVDRGWAGLTGFGSLDTATSVSAPRSCKFFVPADDGGSGHRQGFLTNSFTDDVGRATLSFEVRIGQSAADQTLATIRLSSGGGPVPYLLEFAFNVASPFVREHVAADGGEATVDHPMALGIPADAWTKVTIELVSTASGRTGSLHVDVDGGAACDFTVSAPNAFGTPTVAIGSVDVGPLADKAWTAWFDNVVFDLK